jgi:hypothetical protein
MTRIIFRLNVLIVIIVAVTIVGCDRITSNNQNTSTIPSTQSILTPSQTPFIVSLTPQLETPTPSKDVLTATSDYLCEKVPDPELNKAPNPNNIFLSGKIYLCTYDGSQIAFDFDSGKLGNTESTSTDIKLVISGASIDNRSLYFLREINNSRVAVSEVSMPTQEYCERRTAAENRLKLVLSSAGTTGCVLTNEGRLVFFQVERLDPFGLESVEVSFTAWNKK